MVIASATGSSGSSSRSQPACSDSIASSSFGPSPKPAMRSESVTATPSYSQSLRRMSISTLERVAGLPSGSTIGNSRWPIITLGILSSSARKGSRWMPGSSKDTPGSVWLSCAQAPWPGKCLPQGIPPASTTPCSHAPAHSMTRCTSPPKERLAMIGELIASASMRCRSSTGPKIQRTWAAAASAAVRWPAA